MRPERAKAAAASRAVGISARHPISSAVSARATSDGQIESFWPTLREQVDNFAGNVHGVNLLPTW